MCCHDTEENGRSKLTKETIDSLGKTVDWNKHRLIIVDNASCKQTKAILSNLLAMSNSNVAGNVGTRIRSWQHNEGKVTIITLPENIGTARGLNRAWEYREPGEMVIKIDNDVVINSTGWIEEMEDAISRRPSIGILGLKRKDIIQTTWHPDPEFRTELIMLPHEPGQRWVTFEKSSDVIGTCTMFNHALLDKVGYSFQPGLYGYEDTLFCRRSHIAGFETGFINHIDIDHIDPGGTEYIHWKHKVSGEKTDEMIKIFKQYVSGERSIYQEFY